MSAGVSSVVFVGGMRSPLDRRHSTARRDRFSGWSRGGRCIFPRTLNRSAGWRGGPPLSVNPLFATKSMARLEEEMRDENRLRRILGPVQLTSLGVGAIIGAGIFVATGAAAHNVAGPALILSYVVAGTTCIFAALCYAEFASMVPVAGSAYTYAYATMGELFAWIIGWDLVLEYAVGSATVATGWSGYFQNVLSKLPGGGYQLPLIFRESPWRYDATVGKFLATGSVINLPAIIIVA